MKLSRYHNHPLDSYFRFPALGAGFGTLFDAANRLARFPYETGQYLRDAATLFEDDDNYYARFELPGVKRDELKVELNGNQLELAVHHSSEDDESGETGGASWSHSITVPEGVRAEDVTAKLEDGLLTVTLPKPEERKPRAIEVN